MANYSIPSLIPASGRTSTPLSKRSRRQNSAAGCFFAALSVASAVGSWTTGFFNTQRSTPNVQRSIQKVGYWMLDVGRWTFSLRRVKGASWSSRSSKPSSVPHTRDRGRFDSYPLRQISVAASLCRGANGALQFTATQRRRYSSPQKGGDPYVA